MKRHVAAVVALLTTWAVLDSHVDWVEQDARPLLEVNGQRFDVLGWVAEQQRAWARDCSAVATADGDTAGPLVVLEAIAQHSPPDSLSARWLQWRSWGEWGVAEVSFDTLQPSLVVLRWQEGKWRVQEAAVWSGSTAPWNSADFVRRYLRQQAPELPQTLLQCLNIDPMRYGPGAARWTSVSAHAAMSP